MTTNKVINGKFEFDFKKAGFKFASETEMYICNYIKIWKRMIQNLENKYHLMILH